MGGKTVDDKASESSMCMSAAGGGRGVDEGKRVDLDSKVVVIGGVSGVEDDEWFGRQVDHARMSTGLIDGRAAFMAR
jgi:hypothetical protein